MEQKSVFNYIDAIQKIKQAILASRYRAAVLANRELLSLYFGIGKFVSENSREGFWGMGAIDTISSKLQIELPGLRGFSPANIKRMRQFYEEWLPCLLKSENRPLSTDEVQTDLLVNRPLLTDEIVGANFQNFLSVGFTHHYEVLIRVKTPEERMFYINLCAAESWSVEKLKYNLKSNLYANSGALLNNFQKTISNQQFQNKLTHSFKDEYLLDFINIEDPDDIDERILENEIVLHIKKFIMALGSDFSFMGNQYNIRVDEKDYYIDLLFYNRRIQSLVAIELKRGEFKPEFAGKMNFYLSALDEYVKLPHENPSVGIILCKSQSKKIVEFAFRDTNKPMGVSVYKLSAQLPEIYQNILPNAEELIKLL